MHKELSIDEIKKFIKEYPRYTDEDIQKMYNISQSQIEHTSKTFRLKKIRQLAYDYLLTKKELEEFKRLYPTTSNAILAVKYDLSKASMYSLGHKYGLQKLKIKKEKPTKVLRKTCSRCGSRRSIKNFRKSDSTKDGYYPICSPCLQYEYRERRQESMSRIIRNTTPAPQWWIDGNKRLLGQRKAV